MAIDFSPAKWDAVRERWGNFWKGKDERPVVCFQVRRDGEVGTKPAAPLLTQGCALDFSIRAEDLVERMDYELSQNEYLGAAFPSVNMDCFGPGVLAAFCGARMDDSSGRIWFHPPREDMPIEEIHFEFNAEHPVLLRMLEIYRAMHRKWRGQVQLGHTDMGGNLDLLAHMRTTERLLMDLYDSPQEVLRCMGEIYETWWKFFEMMQSVIQPENPGCTNWLGYFSEAPSYTTQCDFCYMISPEMFGEFALPELEKTWARLGLAVYHLDGIGQRAHLPAILKNRDLAAIQWVPGDGQPDETQWAEIYRAIAGAGKKIVCNDPFCIPAIVEQTGCGDLVAGTNRVVLPASGRGAAVELLRRCGELR